MINGRKWHPEFLKVNNVYNVHKETGQMIEIEILQYQGLVVEDKRLCLRFNTSNPNSRVVTLPAYQIENITPVI